MAKQGFHLFNIPNQFRAEAGDEIFGLNRDNSRIDRSAFLLPAGQATIQHRHPVMAENAEGPPDPGRGHEKITVIRDDERVIADAQFADRFGKIFRARQHVRKRGGMVGDGIYVEELRARNVNLIIFCFGVAVLGRHKEAAVKHDQIFIAEPGGQPVSIDQRVKVFACHGFLLMIGLG